MKAFSVPHFFNFFKDELEKINTYPLTLDNLLVQKDFFASLGDENGPDVCFAHLGIDFPPSDTALLFSVDFFPQDVLLSIDGQPPVTFAYVQLASTPKDAATQLIKVLKALSNGQAVTLYTYTEDTRATQAVELICRKSGTTRVLRTFPFFEKARKLKDRSLDFTLHRNEYEIPESDVDTDLLAGTFPRQEFSSFNRHLKNNVLSPLAREVWESNISARYQQRADEIVAKVEKAAGVTPGASFKEMYLHYAEKRHTSLTVLLAVISSIIALSSNTFGVLGGLLIGLLMALAALLLFLRGSRWRPLLAMPVAYCSVIGTGFVFFLHYQPSVLHFIALVVVVVEIIECIVLDGLGVDKT
jgi:hypothetical protein